MRLHQLCTTIQERHAKGETYQSIANSYNISKPMAFQIAHGYKPGKRTRNILKLEPESDLAYTRKRGKTLDQIAQEWGFANWSAYETCTIQQLEDICRPTYIKKDKTR